MNDPRFEIVRIDRELDVLLALPESEAARRIEQAYQTATDRAVFVAALIGRLFVQRGSNRRDRDDN